jgi:hypothetical protein
MVKARGLGNDTDGGRRLFGRTEVDSGGGLVAAIVEVFVWF